MSVEVVTTGYTTGAVSRTGLAVGGSDALELFLREFGELVLQAYEETNKFEKHCFQKGISKGKSETFPVIGRKRDAFEHVPGSLITGGEIEHNEVEISLDPILVDAVFVAEIDELMNHYDVRAPYARQLGESLAVTYDRRAAIMHLLAARNTVAPYTGGPVGDVIDVNNMATDTAVMIAALFTAAEHIVSNDISGMGIRAFFRPRQYFLLAQAQNLDSVQWTGTANIAEGTVKRIAGIDLDWSNHIPSTNITTGNTKYRGNFIRTHGIVSTPMAVGSLNRRGLRVVHKPQEDRLGHLMIASRANGMGLLRPECAIELADTP